MNVIELLQPLRKRAGEKLTHGLDDATILRFSAQHPELKIACEEAVAAYRQIAVEFPELMDCSETAQLHAFQAGYVNFYADDTINPYVAIAARGPWVITLKGAVVHDSGGYGMLGSSVFVANPPHTLFTALQPVLPFLVRTLGQFDGARSALDRSAKS